MADPLILAGGPGSANPEPMARFIDAFVLGDGEEALPAVCDCGWKCGRRGLDRADALARLAATLPYVYVPRFYQPQFDAQGRPAGLRPMRDDLPPGIEPAVVQDLDAARGARWPPSCRIDRVRSRADRHRDHAGLSRGAAASARAGALKHPVRFRRVETIVAAALQAYRATGHRRSRPAGALVERLSADRRVA